MQKAKVVGRVTLHQVGKTKKIQHTNNNINMSASMVECAIHLRKHGVMIDGKHKAIKNPNVGIRLLGQIDWLKDKGFSIIS